MNQRYQFQFSTVQLFKTESLGTGSYGAVCKAKCDLLPCAAKLLHPILFQFSDPGIQSPRRRFEQECRFLNAMKHPNIVQHLGTTQDPDSGLPVLLMELMDESLTHFLERSQQLLPYHVEVNLCHDIALALDYLHSNDVIHRDLSSNNVLLIAGSRAKITDFGMSKLLSANPRMTPSTMCPGTLVYMPPEALRDPPIYSKKIDSFSFGVLAIQIMTRQFPDPDPAMRAIAHPQSPVGTILIPVPESERRKSHIDLIDATHPLLLIALRCLSYSEEERPSAQDLCQVATLKEAPRYTQSMEQAQNPERGRPARSDDTERQLREVREQNARLSQQNCELQSQLNATIMELQQSSVTLVDSQRENQRLSQELQIKDDTLVAMQRDIQQLKQQLHMKDDTLEARQRDIQQLQQANEEQQHTIQDKERQLIQLSQGQKDARKIQVESASGEGQQSEELSEWQQAPEERVDKQEASQPKEGEGEGKKEKKEEVKSNSKRRLGDFEQVQIRKKRVDRINVPAEIVLSPKRPMGQQQFVLFNRENAASYLQQNRSLWLTPNISRQDAAKLLYHQPAGAFVVRKSHKARYALSLRLPTSDPPVSHFLIDSNEQGYLIQGSNLPFRSIFDLLAYYCFDQRASGDMPCLLRVMDAKANEAPTGDAEESSDSSDSDDDYNEITISPCSIPSKPLEPSNQVTAPAETPPFLTSEQREEINTVVRRVSSIVDVDIQQPGSCPPYVPPHKWRWSSSDTSVKARLDALLLGSGGNGSRPGGNEPPGLPRKMEPRGSQAEKPPREVPPIFKEEFPPPVLSTATEGEREGEGEGKGTEKEAEFTELLESVGGISIIQLPGSKQDEGSGDSTGAGEGKSSGLKWKPGWAKMLQFYKKPHKRIKEFILRLARDQSHEFGRSINDFISNMSGQKTEAHQMIFIKIREFITMSHDSLLQQHHSGLLNCGMEACNNFEHVVETSLQQCIVQPLSHYVYLRIEDYFTQHGHLVQLQRAIYQGKHRTPQEFGIRRHLIVPSEEAIAEIQLVFVRMMNTYCAISKLEYLLEAVKLTYKNVHDSRHLKKSITDLEDDDFLPLFVWVLVHCSFHRAEIEAEYMWGLAHPSLFSGEAGCYLTKLTGAVHLLKESTQPPQSSTPELQQHPNLRTELKVFFEDENTGKYFSACSLSIIPTMTAAEICEAIADRHRKPNPQDYALFTVVNGEATMMEDHERPHKIKLQWLLERSVGLSTQQPKTRFIAFKLRTPQAEWYGTI